MMAEKKKKISITVVSREKASRIIRQYLIRQTPMEFELHDGIPEGGLLYNINNMLPFWSVFIPSNQTGIGPIRIICVSKKTGIVIYDGPTNDE